ncbi:hypothetical protein [Roseibium litorale]|uniref:Tetratricopeptide repeat protein n=1 Tax=Roseibium litorale TaxID=2803841 RepID=A0ABR9CSZ0_9HYPH|nr:hypothetical protein [Roseibium litorale]MBD8894001.1 hypothetical protein [Roseibium litorale]
MKAGFFLAKAFLLLPFFNAVCAQEITRTSPSEIQQARSECETQLSQTCLKMPVLDKAALVDRGTRSSQSLKQAAMRIAANEKRQSTERKDSSGLSVDQLLAMGDWEAAEKRASESYGNVIVEFGTPRGSFIKLMIAAQLKRGEVDQALKAAGSLSPSWNERTQAYLMIVRHLGANESYSELLTIPDMLQKPDEKAEVLTGIVEVLVAKGELETAQEVIASIRNLSQTSPYLSSLANRSIVSLAQGYFEQGDHMAASNVLLDSHFLESLSVSSPDTFSAAARLLLALGEIRTVRELALNASNATIRAEHVSDNDRSQRLSLAARFLVRAGLEAKGNEVFDDAQSLIRSGEPGGKEAFLEYHVNRILAQPQNTSSSDVEAINQFLRKEKILEPALFKKVQPLLDSGHLQ